MILYSVVTTYQLLEALVHKAGARKEQSAVLLISHWLRDKYPWYMDMLEMFQQIAVFPAGYQYEDAAEGRLVSRFEELLAKEQISLDDMEEIHVFGAEHAFGAYIELSGYPYMYWEEGAGALSKKDGMLELFIKAYGEEKAVFQCEHHLADGEGAQVQHIFYDAYYQEKEVSGNHLIHFDLAEELAALTQEDRNRIIHWFYPEDRYCAGKKTALILTEHFANLSVMTWEEQMYSYKYMADYFLGEYHLLFKPHPDDTMYYEDLFEGCQVMRTRFPAELLPFIFTDRPDCIATSSSTSIYGLRTQFDKVVEFNFRYSHSRQFYRLSRYDTALSFADDFVRAGYRLQMLGVNSVIVDNFQNMCALCPGEYDSFETMEQFMENNPYDRQKRILLVDEVPGSHAGAKNMCDCLRQLSEDVIVIFLNSGEDYVFYDMTAKDLWKQIKPIEITTEVLENRCNDVDFGGPHLNENKKETIYIFDKGGRSFMHELKKELPNVGVTVKAKGFDQEKMQIKLLEGMLEATEKRLLYYIEREKELEKQIESMKK